jgi:hypothetical protein
VHRFRIRESSEQKVQVSPKELCGRSYLPRLSLIFHLAPVFPPTLSFWALSTFYHAFPKEHNMLHSHATMAPSLSLSFLIFHTSLANSFNNLRLESIFHSPPPLSRTFPHTAADLGTLARHNFVFSPDVPPHKCWENKSFKGFRVERALFYENSTRFACFAA